MDFEFGGFDSGFEDFDSEIEDIEVKRTGKYGRVFTVGKGGSICVHNSHGKYVYFGSMDCYFYKIDCESGEEVWRFKAGDIILGKPTDVILRKVLFGSYDKNIYCLDFETGEEIWRLQSNGKFATSSVAVHEGKVYAGNQTGTFYCLDFETGKELWQFHTGGEICSTASFSGGKVFIGSFDNYMYCLDAENGKEIWRFRTGGEIQVDLPPSVRNGVVHFTSFDSYLYAIDIESGKEIWRFRTGKYGNSGSPVIHNDILYQGSREGFFFAISPEGKEIWRFRADGMTEGMGFLGDRILIGSEDGHVYCLDIHNGSELWRFRAGGPVFDFPTVYENRIYVGSWDCRFYCISSEGELVWSFNTSSQTQAPVGKPHDTFKAEVKHESRLNDSMDEDKYRSENEKSVSLSDYHVESEYATTSDYKAKSDYDVDMVIIEGIKLTEELVTWISSLADSIQNRSAISTQR